MDPGRPGADVPEPVAHAGRNEHDGSRFDGLRPIVQPDLDSTLIDE